MLPKKFLDSPVNKNRRSKVEAGPSDAIYTPRPQAPTQFIISLSSHPTNRKEENQQRRRRMELKIHGFPMPTSTARVLTCAYEKGMEVELLPVNLRTGEHKAPEYLIPALVDDDLTLFESRAINRYLASKFKDLGADLLRHGNPKEEALVNKWIDAEQLNYNPAIAALVYEIMSKPLYDETTDEGAVAANTEKLEKVLDEYEERLSKSKYLAGDFFSLADLNHLPYTFYLMATPKAELITSRPHVKAWWEAISTRPAFMKVAAGMGGNLRIYIPA